MARFLFCLSSSSFFFPSRMFSALLCWYDLIPSCLSPFGSSGVLTSKQQRDGQRPETRKSEFWGLRSSPPRPVVAKGSQLQKNQKNGWKFRFGPRETWTQTAVEQILLLFIMDFFSFLFLFFTVLLCKSGITGWWLITPLFSCHWLHNLSDTSDCDSAYAKVRALATVLG